MKVKIEIEMTPEEAKELFQPFSVSNTQIATNMITEFQKSWFEQYKKLSTDK
jgi:hypothetical protein